MAVDGLGTGREVRSSGEERGKSVLLQQESGLKEEACLTLGDQAHSPMSGSRRPGAPRASPPALSNRPTSADE